MLTLPRETRHLQLSNVEVAFAFVLHDGFMSLTIAFTTPGGTTTQTSLSNKTSCLALPSPLGPQTFATECKALLTSEACQAQLTRFPAADCSTVST